MHLLIIGGSPDHQGGVEAFCERSSIALNRRGNHQIEYFATGNAFMKLRGIPKLLRGLRHMLSYRGKQLDCVWVQYAALPDLIYAFVAKRAGFKVMVTPHLGSNWRSQKRPALRVLSKWLLRSADRLALISPTQELEIALPTSVPRSPIRNFLPADILEGRMADISQRPPQLQIIHSGRLSEGKGTFMVVELCARLKQAGKPFATTITGTADEATMARLHAMIAQHGLQDDITVTGRVSEDALFGYLRGSDVLVHLSSIDSYPLIVLEATACSVFPVCMELAGARNMVETYDGLIVSVEHAVDETAAALIAADVTELRARAEKVATQVRADYAWDNCALALEQALQACVN
jgi:glycosyltransferase involved in cell wall biosynthesis